MCRRPHSARTSDRSFARGEPAVVSQLELAARAAVSTRHLSFLETGRARPSREMVLHLAEELDVPMRERNPLLLAAGFAPAYDERPLDGEEMSAVRAAVEVILAGHEPNPALVVDGRWDLVSANRAVSLFTDLLPQALLTPPINVIRASLHPGGLARHSPDAAEYSAHLIGRLRRQVERTADSALARLLDEVRRYVPGAAWPPLEPPGSDVVVPIRLAVHGETLSFFTTIAVFGAPQDITTEELAIETFFPADRVTADMLIERSEV